MRNILKYIPIIFLLGLIFSCGGGGGSKRMEVTVAPVYPASMDSVSGDLKAVGAIYASANEGADVIAQPVLGTKNDDGSYSFNLRLTSSIPKDGALLQVDFYHDEGSASAIAVKDLAGDIGGGVRVAYALLLLQDENDGNFSLPEEDIETSPDDDGDNLSNLDEIMMGLSPTDADTDDDGANDNIDLFPSASLEWSDLDGDGIGDNTDDDIDGDGLSNDDELIYGSNPDVADTDGDSILDGADNCPVAFNDTQTDTDSDGRGNACEDDTDGDGLSDSQEINYGTDPLLADTDGDGLGDSTEINGGTKPLLADSDGDGTADNTDNCPVNPNPSQENTDGDGFGDLCDADDDNDGTADSSDNCRTVSNSYQEDLDVDGTGDICDDDIDGDEFLNDGSVDSDNCPYVNNPAQLDTDADGDGAHVECDLDDDDERIGAKEGGVFVAALYGLDTNRGRIDSPLASMAAGVAKARLEGKNLYVAAGSYDVGSVVWVGGVKLFGGFLNSDIGSERFSSREEQSLDPEYKTTLTRNDADVTVALSGLSDFLLSGFSVENNEAAASDELAGIRVIEVSGGSVVLDRNKIVGNSDSSQSTAVYSESGANVELERNFIDGRSRGLAGSRSTGVHFINTTGRIVNNIIKGGAGRFSVGIELENSSPVIINNTIDGFSGHGSMGLATGISLEGASPIFINNLLFTGNGADRIPVDCRFDPPTGAAVFRYNLITSFPQETPTYLVRNCDGSLYNDAASLVIGAAVVDSNITFSASDEVNDLVDRRSNGYELAGAVGLDDGLDVSGESYGLISEDYWGIRRPVGAAYDIGAVEED